MTVRVSVPGKIHLMGEHAVVYGKPAFLAAIDRRLTVTLETGESASVRKLGMTVEAPEDHGYISHAVRTAEAHFGLTPLPYLRLSVTSELPVGYHLGSSAAVAAATVAAVIYARKKVWNPQLTNQLAYEVEKRKHGNPSGGDNTAVCFGGFLWFRKELEFLKSIWQLPVKLHPALDHFYLADTGRPEESTGDMVAEVAAAFKRRRRIMETALAENEEQTKRVARAIHDGDERMLIDALSRGQRTLETFGVVSRTAVRFVRDVERKGGAAKILGGGGYKSGVGYMLAYHPKRRVLDTIARKHAFPLERVNLGEEGIRLETERGTTQ